MPRHGKARNSTVRRCKAIFGVMPEDLRAVSEGRMSYAELSARQALVLAEVAPSIAENSDPRVAAVTHLDLLFMLGGYLPAGQDMYTVLPAELNALITRQCERFAGFKPYMTYDLIIDLNTEEYRRTGFMRVFTDGQDAQHERDFYVGHALAEPHVFPVADQMTMLAQGTAAGSELAVLESTRDSLRKFSEYMSAYSRLPKEVFGDFRRYLVTYQDGTRNASGAFMPSVQLLELSLAAPTPMYDLFLAECDPYFPEAARSVITARREAAKVGLNIEDQLRSGQLNLGAAEFAALLQVVDAFIHFRMLHLGVTKAQIPEAFSSMEQLTRKHIAGQGEELQILEPDFEGSAGFDVRNVLTNSVYRLFALRERLTKLGENNGIR